MTASNNPPLACPIRTADSRGAAAEHLLTVVDANNAVLFTTQAHVAREIVRICNSQAALAAALKNAVHLLAKVEACEMAEYCGANVGDYLAAAEKGNAALAQFRS